MIKRNNIYSIPSNDVDFKIKQLYNSYNSKEKLRLLACVSNREIKYLLNIAEGEKNVQIFPL